ncbi:MAG TPA: hypothetical protein VF316_18830 [Polyangiaceae bacterium]
MDLRGERTTGQLSLRYEDVAQDGRLLLETMPVALGVVWRNVLVPGELRDALTAQGILPILTRFQIEGTAGPFPAVGKPLDVEGGYQVSHDVDAHGSVARLLLDMDAELWGAKGRTNLPPPDDAGARVLAGRVRAEHVFTRPFAPAEQRKVLSLPLGGKAFVPETRREWRTPQTTLDVPASARALDATYTEDPMTYALGLTHTDSNQHVNSLVYPRFFEEAALRRLASLGRSTNVLARTLDIAFRRPSFGGEKLRILLQAYEDGPRIVCTGVFLGEGETDVRRARVFVQMGLEP